MAERVVSDLRFEYLLPAEYMIVANWPSPLTCPVHGCKCVIKSARGFTKHARKQHAHLGLSREENGARMARASASESLGAGDSGGQGGVNAAGGAAAVAAAPTVGSTQLPISGLFNLASGSGQRKRPRQNPPETAG